MIFVRFPDLHFLEISRMSDLRTLLLARTSRFNTLIRRASVTTISIFETFILKLYGKICPIILSEIRTEKFNASNTGQIPISFSLPRNPA